MVCMCIEMKFMISWIQVAQKSGLGLCEFIVKNNVSVIWYKRPHFNLSMSVSINFHLIRN